MKIDSGLGPDLASVERRVRAAERAGLDGLWASETTNDPFLSLALAAEHSETVSLGTAIAIAFARNPMTLAYTTNQLQEFARGRLVLGLGSQVRAHIERRYGAAWSHPVDRMREYVLALRAIWASWNDGVTLDVDGRFYHHTLMTPLFTPRPHPYGPPRVFLAAVGPRMTEMAGEVADGIITHGLSSPAYLRQVTLPSLERGLARSGRSRSEVDVTCPGFIAVADDERQREKARADMRRHVAFYASTPAYRPVLDVHGWGDVQPELYQRSKVGAWKEMGDLIDDEMLDTFTIIGPHETLASEVRQRYGGLADRITVAWWQKEWWPPVGEELRAL